MTEDDEIVEAMARAIEGVRLFERFNDWTGDHVPGLPVEICRHGPDDEDEIVVTERHAAHFRGGPALTAALRIARARAALRAYREMRVVL